MRAMGLDVGMKTIGVAVSDELGLAAHPVETLARQGTARDVARVIALARARDVEDIVVGLPLELSGAVGRRALRVRVFTSALGQALDQAGEPAGGSASESAGGGLPIKLHEWDERFSTAAVERVLIEADLSRRRRKQVIDQQAAAYILQGWLDAQRKPPDMG